MLEQSLLALKAELRDQQRSIVGRGRGPAKTEAESRQPASSATSAEQKAAPVQRPAQAAALSEPEDVDALRDLQVVRDQAVTVKPGTFEVSSQIKYVRANGFLSFDRAVIGTSTARAGIAPGLEVSASLPYYYSFRNTQLSQSEYEKKTIERFGDASFQVTGTLFRETIDLPGVFGYASINVPTGPNPYRLYQRREAAELEKLSSTNQNSGQGSGQASGQNSGQTAGQNLGPGKISKAQFAADPTDPFFFTQSSGHYANTIGFTLAKTFEPIVLFGGLNYTHLWGKTFTDVQVLPGDRFGYSFGFGFAVSERTSIGALIQGAFVRTTKVRSLALETLDTSSNEPLPPLHPSYRKGVAGLPAEPVSLTLSLTQKVGPGLFIEPSATLGMTKDAPAASMALNARKTF